MDKKTILETALTARNAEILQYQIDIDNFRRAIILSDKDPDLTDFSSRLRELLASSILEQKKAIIIRDVIKEQLEE